tara:strand:+ start:3054 stop:3317 length:264 start_codon:yes stop_codon:yes gene_type:complete
MDENTPIELTRGELKELLQEAVQDAFTKMGMDVLDPLEMQRDFQHLRDWRLAVASVQSKSMLTLVGLLIAGFVAALWIGFKAAVHGP